MIHLTDTHTHTWYSNDAHCNMEEVCRAAWEGGLSAVAITDHFEYKKDGVPSPYYLLRVEGRTAELARVKARWEGRLEVLRGVEIGQPHWNAAHSRAVAASGDYDMVIGSLHDLRPGRSIYTDYDYSKAEVRDEMYRQFFEEAREMVRVADFDTFGHYDYPIRKMEGYVEPTLTPWKSYALPFLKELAESGRALEVNTVGQRRWMGCVGGEQWVLEAFRQYGGRYVTVGTDAHYARHVGIHVREAYEAMRAAGFDKVTIYRQRKPVQLSI